MTRTGLLELVRRFLCLLFCVLGLVALGYWGGFAAALLFIGAFLIYLVIPRPRPPPSALTYEKIPAVYGPDLLGLMMTSVFTALPFWVGMGEEYMWQDYFLPLHPSAILSWPLAFVCATILVAAASYASFWLVVEQDGLHLHSMRQDRFIAFGHISRVIPLRRGLPRWLRWLTPLLVLTGRHAAAGEVLLARDTTDFSLCLTDGSIVHIDESAFVKPAKKIVQALTKNGVSLAMDG